MCLISKEGMIMKKTLCVMALATLVAAPAMAQEKVAEVSFLLGWSFADGIDGQQVLALDGNLYDRIDPKDSFKWGLMGGALVGENAEVGFMYSQAMSKLVVSGTQEVEVGDMSVHNYHGYFGYNWLDPEMPARPYFFFGLGATSYGAVDFTQSNGVDRTINSETRFSTTWGIGVKIAPSRPVGARFGIQWTPTYITSEAGGWWCDPWWGCYLVGNAKYANAWDLGGGLSFRF
jgi:opacity protein-like surface antigen